ncbi:hypothetical protein RJ639_038974 [Escallonia herrerae]|uniref:Uncharacterized protein n=1 Tax=Escallonia herrerae TaxID=1293975 RepID=A0AA88WM51_9ASTE|nr:hypothetical protein RJ639_038974 [Escallonia herrerae]
MNAEEQPMKGVVKNIDLRISGWTWKVDLNIIDMDELEVVLGMDFMEKSSATLNPYCKVMAGKEGQPEWMIPLVSKDGADTRKGITVFQLDKGSMLCYGFRWSASLPLRGMQGGVLEDGNKIAFYKCEITRARALHSSSPPEEMSSDFPYLLYLL